MIWISILLLITALIAWLCFLKINVSLNYSFIDQKQTLQCTFTVLTLRIYTYELPDTKKQPVLLKQNLNKVIAKKQPRKNT